MSGRNDLAHIGGAEMQQVLLARGLLQRGMQVSFVTLDHGQPDGTHYGGITVYKAFAPDAGLPGLRFLHPRCTGLWQAMRRSQATVYYQRMAEMTTGIVAAYCRRHQRKFVFAPASNYDCMVDLPKLPSRRERTLYRFGLRHAQVVLAQTAYQQQLLDSQWAIKARLLPNGAPDYGADHAALKTTANVPQRLIWIGGFTHTKRLEMLIDVAGLCPELQFDVVGAQTNNTDRSQQLDQALRALPNINWHGRLPHAEVLKLLPGVGALINTSRMEGFPNTFAEAWSFGVPVVSTFDPDGVIAGQKLGAVAQDAQGLAQAAKNLLGAKDLYHEASSRARAHYLSHHTMDAVIDRFEQTLRELAA